MNKLQMAHEMALAIQSSEPMTDMVLLSSLCFSYADAMFAEFEKREKEEAAKKRVEIQKLLNADNTFIEREGQHFDDVNWQPDWSLAPENAVACVIDSNDMGCWYTEQPTLVGNAWSFWGTVGDNFRVHDYTGDWRDSLRIRPEGV